MDAFVPLIPTSSQATCPCSFPMNLAKSWMMADWRNNHLRYRQERNKKACVMEVICHVCM